MAGRGKTFWRSTQSWIEVPMPQQSCLEYLSSSLKEQFEDYEEVATMKK